MVAVIRHGDRTPKQKMKLKVTEPEYLAFFHAYSSSPKKDLKVGDTSIARLCVSLTPLPSPATPTHPAYMHGRTHQIPTHILYTCCLPA